MVPLQMAPLQILFNGQLFPLVQKQTLVGRSRGCGIVLTSRLASREHCVIERNGAGLTLIELGSRNGTWVNGERVVRRRELAKGDQIRVGSDELEVTQRQQSPSVNGRKTQRMNRSPSSEPFGDDLTGAVDHRSVLDLAEVLIETASTPDQRPQTCQVIVAAVDELLDNAGLTQPYLNSWESKRLRAIADRVVSWWPDGDMDQWREGIERRMRAAQRSNDQT